MASEKIVQNENVDELASVILAKISDKLLEKIRSEESAAYPVVLSYPLVIREEGIENKHNSKMAKPAKDNKGEKTRTKNVSVMP